MEDIKTDTNLKKNKTADVGKYTYQYVDIAQIHEYLEKNHMRYYQFIDRINDDDYIMTQRLLQEIDENGKYIEDSYIEWGKPLRGVRVVDATLIGVNNPAQQQGSAITYARRYSLFMAFGLATEDDDAQSLTKPQEEITNPEQAENYKINFGKYKGKTIKEVMEIDTDYINWLSQNGDDRIKKCLDIIDEYNIAKENQYDLPF